MKKNFITIITALFMLVPTAAVFAENEPEVQGDIMLISDDIPVDDDFAPVTAMPSYIRNTVTVTEINENMISTTTNTEDAENPENTVNFTVTDETVVLRDMDGSEIKASDIKKDDVITVFTNVYDPAPYILPPQYTASVIIVNVREISSSRFYDVDTYVKNEDGALVNISNTLSLNLGEETKITGLKGKMVTEDELENKDLAVIYMNATRSIPAQTTPIAIYVLGENEQALAAYEAAKTTTVPEPTETFAPVFDFAKVTAVKAGNETVENFYVKDGILMLPLRKIVEAKGFTVEWDENLKAVTLNSGIYSLKIGENSYNKGRMMPLELNAAPEIKNDRTFVPVDYFLDILELQYSANDGVLEF